MKTPILIPIDMSLTSGHEHPQVVDSRQYLLLIDGFDDTDTYITGKAHHPMWAYGELRFMGRSIDQVKQVWEICDDYEEETDQEEADESETLPLPA